MRVLPLSSGPRLGRSSMAKASLLVGLPGVKDSTVWSQHAPGSALFLPSQLVRSVLPLSSFFYFLVGQDIPGDVFELLVELTIIRVTFLESSLRLVNQTGAIHLEPRSLTEYQGSFIALPIIQASLPI